MVGQLRTILGRNTILPENNEPVLSAIDTELLRIINLAANHEWSKVGLWHGESPVYTIWHTRIGPESIYIQRQYSSYHKYDLVNVWIGDGYNSNFQYKPPSKLFYTVRDIVTQLQQREEITTQQLRKEREENQLAKLKAIK